MTSARQELIQRFRDLGAIEHEAYRLYKSLLKYVTDTADRKILEGIMADEQKHVEFAGKIVAILEQAPKG